MQPGFQDMRVLATVSLLVMLAFQLIFLVNFFYSLFWGIRLGRTPGRPTPWNGQRSRRRLMATGKSSPTAIAVPTSTARLAGKKIIGRRTSPVDRKPGNDSE